MVNRKIIIISNEDDETRIKFIRKEGVYIICEKEGFVFKIHKTNYPVNKVSPSQCLTPTTYYKYLVRKVHGDTYDLSQVEFTGADNKVKVRCNHHGEFHIASSQLTRGQGCRLCGNVRRGLSRRSHTSAFTDKAVLVHGDRYDYSTAIYSGAKEPITITCKVHGEFTMQPSNHLAGKGCYQCGVNNSRLSRVLSQEEVLKRFREVHYEKYDYSNVNYSGDAHAHLQIICQHHGEFKQSYANHNSGQGCPICAREYNPFFKTGFIKSYKDKDYASLYLIRCYSIAEVFYKIGITTKPVKTRFAGEEAMPYSYEVLHLCQGEGGDIWEYEKSLHRIYRSKKYTPLLNFGGSSECFSHIELSDFRKNLNEIKTSHEDTIITEIMLH